MRTAVVLVLCFIATVLVGVPASAAPVPKHLMKEAENTEEAKIQGQWKLESFVIDKVPLQVAISLEFRGTKLTGTSEGRAISATIKLDIVDGVKCLAVTNMQVMDGMGQRDEEEDTTYGYSIDGDKLTLVTSLGERKKLVDPAKPRGNTIVLVLTRIKEKN
jgi:hypothetical protein